MATKGKQQEKSKKTNGNANELPAGYEPVSSAENTAWAIKEEGNTIEGLLLGRFTRKFKGKTRSFYQVKLVSPCKAIQGRGEDAERTTLEKGAIVSFDETSGLERDLRPLTDDGGKYHVFIRFIEKIDLDGGNTFWRMKIGKKTISPPTRKPIVSAPVTETESEPVEDDDIPF